MKGTKTAVTLAVGAAFAASLSALPVANATDNPFALDSLKSGYQVAGDDKKAEGKCGEGKCGGSKTGDKKTDGKCGEGKCGGSKTGAVEGDKKTDGKCGEGKCGGSKK